MDARDDSATCERALAFVSTCCSANLEPRKMRMRRGVMKIMIMVEIMMMMMSSGSSSSTSREVHQLNLKIKTYI